MQRKGNGGIGANRAVADGISPILRLKFDLIGDSAERINLAQVRAHCLQVELGSSAVRMRFDPAIRNNQRLSVCHQVHVVRPNAAG